MNQEKIKEWYKLIRQYKNGYHMEKSDWQELLRLNHEIMLLSHEIHNKNMMKGV